MSERVQCPDCSLVSGHKNFCPLAGLSGLAAWMPAPGPLFGIQRSPRTCAHAGCSRELTLGQQHCSEHEPVRIRKPLFPELSAKALPGTIYTVWSDLMRDEVLLRALDPDGYGRQLVVDGKLMHLWKQQTNAPEGERALLDDDFEAILQKYAHAAEGFSPGPDAQRLEEADKLAALALDLFETDPEVLAYVKLRAERPENLDDALMTAHVRAEQGLMPEAEWGDNALRRARAILNRRGA